MKYLIKLVQVLLVLFISYWALVTHAMLASGYVDALIAGRSYEPMKLFHPETQGAKFISRYGIEGNQGAYNTIVTLSDDGAYRYEFNQAYSNAVRFAKSKNTSKWGELSRINPPYRIPFYTHVYFVLVVRVLLRLDCWRRRGSQRSKPFCSHLLLTAVYAYFIMICFQSARMLWANEIVGTDAYLNDSVIGDPSLYILLGLSIVVYLYCVIGTARLRVRRRPNAKKNTCIRCGYTLDGIEGNCPECDLEPEAYVASKLRLNHWYLAAMLLITFFSPVLVASVHRVIW